MRKAILSIVLVSVLLTVSATDSTHAANVKSSVKEHRELIKKHIYSDFKQMYRQPTGIALIHPYLTPGSKQYANVLLDYDPSTFFRPKGSSASIYLNCLMYKELRAMSYLAEQLQLPEAKQRYTLMADSLRDAVRQWCWDEKDGMYYSVDLNLVPYTGEPQIIFGKPFVLHQGAPRDYPCLIQRIGCWSGFMTLWAGIATPEQARRMVKENLLDERTFWGTYGVRTLSKQEKMYNLRATNNPSNWQGPLWGISNYMVWRGLAVPS